MIIIVRSYSPFQRKLFNVLLFNAHPDFPFKQKFAIRGKELHKLIGYNSNDSSQLKKALLGLITTSIERNVIDSNIDQKKNGRLAQY